ncbi:MAG: NFACT family protein, partial [bacterium]
MSLSHTEIRRAIAEAQPLLAGGRLENADQPRPTTVVLTLYAQRAKRYLLLATQPGFSRIHLTGRKPRREGEVGPFARQVRQLLRGRSLAGIEVAPDDRIVTLTFGRADEPAGLILAELTGRTANVYLLKPDGSILAALRSTRKADRDLRPGAAYQPPPPAPTSKAAARDRFSEIVESGAKSTYNEAVDRHYADAEARERLTSRRNGLAARIKAERKRARRLLANLEADAGKAGDADHLRLCGELLKLHLHEIRPHQSAITVPNVFEPDQPDLEIQLQPNLKPQQNMERYFRRYKKLVAAREQLEDRIARTRARLEELDRAALEVQEAESVEALDAVAADLGLSARKRKRRKAPASGPHRFTS